MHRESGVRADNMQGNAALDTEPVAPDDERRWTLSLLCERVEGILRHLRLDGLGLCGGGGRRAAAPAQPSGDLRRGRLLCASVAQRKVASCRKLLWRKRRGLSGRGRSCAGARGLCAAAQRLRHGHAAAGGPASAPDPARTRQNSRLRPRSGAGPAGLLPLRRGNGLADKGRLAGHSGSARTGHPSWRIPRGRSAPVCDDGDGGAGERLQLRPCRRQRGAAANLRYRARHGGKAGRGDPAASKWKMAVCVRARRRCAGDVRRR